MGDSGFRPVLTHLRFRRPNVRFGSARRTRNCSTPIEKERQRGDVEAAARRLQIKITPHEVALMKATPRLPGSTASLPVLKQRGDMKVFNRAYRAKRAAADGHFMSYTVAAQRLRRGALQVHRCRRSWRRVHVCLGERV